MNEYEQDMKRLYTVDRIDYTGKNGDSLLNFKQADKSKTISV